MSRRLSDLRSGLPCPRCGRSLTPYPAGGSVRFHCKSGHGLDLEEALSAPSAVLRAGLEALLNEWKRQHRALVEITEHAARHGHVDIARIFARRAGSVGARIDILKSAFARTESSKLLRIPESVRDPGNFPISFRAP